LLSSVGFLSCPPSSRSGLSALTRFHVAITRLASSGAPLLVCFVNGPGYSPSRALLFPPGFGFSSCRSLGSSFLFSRFGPSPSGGVRKKKVVHTTPWFGRAVPLLSRALSGLFLLGAAVSSALALYDLFICPISFSGCPHSFGSWCLHPPSVFLFLSPFPPHTFALFYREERGRGKREEKKKTPPTAFVNCSEFLSSRTFNSPLFVAPSAKAPPQDPLVRTKLSPVHTTELLLEDLLVARFPQIWASTEIDFLVSPN